MDEPTRRGQIGDQVACNSCRLCIYLAGALPATQWCAGQNKSTRNAASLNSASYRHHCSLHPLLQRSIAGHAGGPSRPPCSGRPAWRPAADGNHSGEQRDVDGLQVHHFWWVQLRATPPAAAGARRRTTAVQARQGCPAVQCCSTAQNMLFARLPDCLQARWRMWCRTTPVTPASRSVGGGASDRRCLLCCCSLFLVALCSALHSHPPTSPARPTSHPPLPACVPLLQLFCDLRANTPKDRRFLQRHTRAFMPHTAPGWLVRRPPTSWAAFMPACSRGCDALWAAPACWVQPLCHCTGVPHPRLPARPPARPLPPLQAMASALGFSFAGMVALACTTVAISVAGVGSLVGLALASGGCHRCRCPRSVCQPARLCVPLLVSHLLHPDSSAAAGAALRCCYWCRRVPGVSAGGAGLLPVCGGAGVGRDGLGRPHE